MTRFEVLDRSLNPLGTHLLEASAGTGKTFTIQHLVVRLILQADMSIEQILVVTFTRAATRELKERVRSNLERVLKDLKTGKSSLDYLQALIDEGEKSILQAQERIDAALTCFDRAQIFTIHSFCHRMLSEFAFEANIAMNLDDPDENQQRSLLKTTLFDFFRTDLDQTRYSPAQIHALLSKYAHDPDRLADRLIAVSQNKAEIETSPAFHEVHRLFVEEIKGIGTLNIEKLADDFERLRSCYKGMTGSEYPEQMHLMAQVLSNGKGSEEEFDRLLFFKDFFLEKMQPENLKAKAKLPEAASLNYPVFWQKHKETLSHLIKLARDPLKVFLRLAKDFQGHSSKTLEKLEKLTPDQILFKMEQCLQEPRFCEKVRNKYRAAIIDEFQDTDPIQWNIFKTCFLGFLPAVYLVGDPKQSIYGFRNADIYTYLDAASYIGQDNIRFLDTNYRSDPSLVHALNSLFSQPAQGRWLELPAKNSALIYHKVRPRDDALDRQFSDNKGHVHFFLAGSEGEKKRNVLAAWERERFFPFIAKEMVHLHENESIAFKDMAILVRDRYQAGKLLAFLHKLNIPTCVKRASSLAASVALIEWQRWIAAALDPLNPSKLKQCLGGPLVGWTHTDFLNGTHWTNARALIHQLGKTLEQDGIASFFQEFLQSKWKIHGKTVLEKLAGRDDLSLYEDFRQWAEILIEHQTQSLASAAGLLAFLKQLEMGDADENELLKRRQQGSQEAASIMTIHVSKGLEFEIVFALGLVSRFKGEEQEIAVNCSGEEKIREFDPDDSACQEAIKEQDAEKMRHLYVALTRAKRRVYIPGGFDQAALGIGKKSPLDLFFSKMSGSDIPDLQSIIPILDEIKSNYSVSYEHLNGLNEEIAYSNSGNKTLLIPPKIPHLPQNTAFIQSFSSLHKEQPKIFEKKETKPEERSIHQMPGGAETGHLLHRILEQVFGSSNDKSHDRVKFLVEKETAHTPLENWSVPITESIQILFGIKLRTAEKEFSLKEVDLKNAMVEMAFLYPTREFSRGSKSKFEAEWGIYPHENGMLQGFIDFVFEFEGKIYFIDWKSNDLGNSQGDYTDSAMEAEMRNRGYYLQASIYAEALQKYVKLFDKEDVESLIGGAFYIFIRGGIAFYLPPLLLFQNRAEYF